MHAHLMRTHLVLLGLLASACGTSSGPVKVVGSSPCGSPAPRPSDAAARIQSPPVDVSGPFYAARTEGPCGLYVTFDGGPPGPPPCSVEEYTGHLEDAGTQHRLVVEDAHPSTATFPPNTACAGVGMTRDVHITLSAPLDERTVVDPAGHAITLYDSERLLLPHALPAGWAERADDSSSGSWTVGLTGPGNAFGALRQGDARIAMLDPMGEVVGHPTVHGRRGTLVDLKDPNGNFLLSWTDGDAGYVLQVLGDRQSDDLVPLAEGFVLGG